MNELLIKQIIEDYSCSYNDVIDHNNHFTIYKINEGRRKYKHIEECALRMIIVNNKLIFTGQKEIIEVIQEKFKNTDGQWMMEPENLYDLDKLLSKFNQKISMVHPFFISDKNYELKSPYEITKYDVEQLKQFQNNDQYDEAFGGHETTPDLLACSISLDNKIVGMAGASKDSPYMMQIGINVSKEYEGKGIASALVSCIRNDILKMGYLAYYGTSFSHIASQKVALNAGFKMGFVELFTMPINAK